MGKSDLRILNLFGTSVKLLLSRVPRVTSRLGIPHSISSCPSESFKIVGLGSFAEKKGAPLCANSYLLVKMALNNG